MTKADAIVMIADDDPDDRLLAKEAFQDNNLANTIIFTEDGEDLMDYLHRRNKYSGKDLPMPDFIILDLNMPKKDGREVLKELKRDVVLKLIPVIVLSTSGSEADVLTTYELGGNSFISKPVSYESLKETIRVIGNYWFKLVSLPPISNAV